VVEAAAGARRFHHQRAASGRGDQTSGPYCRHPSARGGRRADGALALGIPADFLNASIRQRRLADDTVAALIDSAGTIIAASDLEAARAIFASAPPSISESLHEAVDANGETWRYAIAPVHEQDLFIAFARRRNALLGWNYIDFGVNILLPVMMAFFAFVAIWYAADRFVLRWIAYLERIARAYGGAHFTVRPDTTEAPQEIQNLADAMGDMADNLRTRDASLRHALEQRTLMSREIHHRVKNNLQIVASLMQIESRRLTEPTAREALQLTHTRINAIALVHRILEEIHERTVVNLRTLLSELARMVSDAFGAEYANEAISVDVPPDLLETDAAVPLALYVVEQTAQIYARAAATKPLELKPSIRVQHGDGTVSLTLSCSAECNGGEAGKGPNFIAAYVRQLEGRLSHIREGGRTDVTLEFPDRWVVTLPSVEAA
jgi:two-component sensor histidine kinase